MHCNLNILMSEESINSVLILFLYVMGHLYRSNKMIPGIEVTAADMLFYYVSHYMSLLLWGHCGL